MEPCSQVLFDDLRKKPFTPIPSALLKALIVELPNWASTAYLYLYERCLAHRGGSTIVLSHKQLAAALGVSIRTAGRALSKLKKAGYIELLSHAQSHILANVIRVACPKELVEKIKQEVKDRKTVLPFKAKNRQPQVVYSSHSIENTLSATGTNRFNEVQRVVLSATPSTELQPLSHLDDAPSLPFCNSLSTLSSKQQTASSTDAGSELSYVEQNKDSVTESEPLEPLYQRYQERMATLKENGYSVYRASREAFALFTLEQQRSLQAYILKRPISSLSSNASIDADLAGAIVKNDVHNTNNSNLVNLTIDPSMVDNVKLDRNRSAVNANVILKNASLLKSKHQVFAKVIAKLKAMAKSGAEIHPRILDQYPSLGMLIQEVAFHVLYRNDQRTENAEHALQSAAKMIREGRWSTPKKLLYWQTLKREQLADFHKKQTAVQCSALARTLGAALRIN